MNLIRSFIDDQRGASSIEYGMIALLIAVAVVATVQTIGTKLNARYDTVSTKLG